MSTNFMETAKRVYRKPLHYGPLPQRQGSQSADWCVALKRTQSRLWELRKVLEGTFGYSSDLDNLLATIWRDFDGAVAATRDKLKSVNFETRNENWKKRQSTKGEAMKDMTLPGFTSNAAAANTVLALLAMPKLNNDELRILAALDHPAAIAELQVRGADVFNTRTAAAVAGAAGGASAAPTEASPANARELVGMLREAEDRGRRTEIGGRKTAPPESRNPVTPESLPQERRAS